MLFYYYPSIYEKRHNLCFMFLPLREMLSGSAVFDNKQALHIFSVLEKLKNVYPETESVVKSIWEVATNSNCSFWSVRIEIIFSIC